MQSILQKVIGATSDKNISIEQVEIITGSPKGVLLNNIIEAIEKADLNKGLKSLHETVKQNIDSKLFLRLLIERVRSVLLLRFAKDLETEIRDNYTDTDFKFLKDMADNKSSKVNSKILDELLKAYEEINFSAVKEIPLELALIRLLGDRS
jgi:DNA polymerase III gamma/tau subunit